MTDYYFWLGAESEAITDWPDFFLDAWQEAARYDETESQQEEQSK